MFLRPATRWNRPGRRTPSRSSSATTVTTTAATRGAQGRRPPGCSESDVVLLTASTTCSLPRRMRRATQTRNTAVGSSTSRASSSEVHVKDRTTSNQASVVSIVAATMSPISAESRWRRSSTPVTANTAASARSKPTHARRQARTSMERGSVIASTIDHTTSIAAPPSVTASAARRHPPVTPYSLRTTRNRRYGC